MILAERPSLRNEGRFFYSNLFQFLRICKELAKIYMFRRYIYKNAFFYTYHEKKIKKYFADIKKQLYICNVKTMRRFPQNIKSKEK